MIIKKIEYLNNIVIKIISLFFLLFISFIFSFCKTSNTLISAQPYATNRSTLVGSALKDFLSEIDGDTYLSEKYKTLYFHMDSRLLNLNLDYLIRSNFEDLIAEYRLISLLENRIEADLFLNIQVHDFMELGVEHNSLQEPILFKLYIFLQLDVYDQLGNEKKKLHRYNNIRYQIWYSKEDILKFGRDYWYQEFARGITRRLFLLFLSGWYTEEKTEKELNYDKRNSPLSSQRDIETIRLPDSWSFEKRELFLNKKDLRE